MKVLTYFWAGLFILFAFTEYIIAKNPASQADGEPKIETKQYSRNIFQRIFGVPATKNPQNPDCWNYENGTLTIDLEKAPELKTRGGAIRIDNERVPQPVLIVRDDKQQIRAYQNKCQHGGRRLDPSIKDGGICCCSMGKSTYDWDGKKVAGPAEGDLVVFPVSVNGNIVEIEVVE